MSRTGSREVGGVCRRTPANATAGGSCRRYDLVAVATGVNSPTLNLFENLGQGYHPPRTTKASVCEIPLGREDLSERLCCTMHVFLLDLPGVEFAALIPKGDYVTACLLGENIDRSAMQAFLNSPEVRACFSAAWNPPEGGCRCAPKLNVGAAIRPYGDRIVYVGDCGVSRLYKDGIGAAYRTAKAAAATAVFTGVSASAFGGRFRRTCTAIERDNRIGRAVFCCANWLQRRPRLRRAILNVVSDEQLYCRRGCPTSGALWDIFTGSATYSQVVRRMLAPGTWLGRVRRRSRCAANRDISSTVSTRGSRLSSDREKLGRIYENGEIIVREGDAGNQMFVIQSGTVEVYREVGEALTRLALLEEGAVFGEMAICDGETRSASVRALGRVRVLTVDHSTFLRRVHEDPSLALRVVNQLSQRIRSMNDEVAQRDHNRHTI